MPTSPNTSEPKWYDPAWAALLFFTRLPLWHLHQPPTEAYRRVTEWWPLVGWLTAAVTAAVLYGGSQVLPYPVAVLLALAARMFLTGALHEDGLADFFDGFGGGASNRERILAIMKDSHIGTYGVLALLLYVALLFASLWSLPPGRAAVLILVADPYAKMLAAGVVGLLPYARDEQTAKSRIVYRQRSPRAVAGLAVQGLLPMTLAACLLPCRPLCLFVPALPFGVAVYLYFYLRTRLGGYTGDCCGALFLLTELSAFLAYCMVSNL
ncbi:MAG: adenosylcobinamide-GDP ribazoletransferase [Bacteroidaceae bacterium]|nr:adenosylcobinamide-GDP ribazoletransferase [Bacteroidaceae bacterium]